MANEIQISASDHAGAAPLYAVLSQNLGGQFWNGAALENYSPGDWVSYAIPLTLDSTTRLWQADFPPAPNGTYALTIYAQVGGSPAPADTALAIGAYQQNLSPATANEDIQLSTLDYPGPGPVYFVVAQSDTDLYWNGSGLESYALGDWSTYATPMFLDAANGVWGGSFPPVPDGEYLVTLYLQSGATPAETDAALAQGTYPQRLAVDQFPDQLQVDALAFISDFAEPITYLACDDTGSVTGRYYINAVVNRNPQAVIEENGKTLTDDVEINIANDLTLGRPSINRRKDQVILSGRYGGPAKPHTVTTVISGDAGMWTLRVK
jgi:hypothetical protein